MSARGDDVKVKVCGLMRPEDVEAVNAVRPDYAGFILSAGYRRSVDDDLAARLSACLDEGVVAVGVFVDDDPARIARLAKERVIDAVQLHGSEDEAYMASLRALLAEGAARPVPLVKVFQPTSREEAEAALDSTADMVMFDAGKGCGESLDWSVLGGLGRPFMLAGGLDAGNVVSAIGQVAPYGVDVSSGVESNGLKDPGKIAAFVEKARSCSPTGGKGAERKEMTMRRGRFGVHGGQYIPETLMNAVLELEEAYDSLKDDPAFQQELSRLLDEYAGRPSRLYFAERMTADLGGAKVYLKREDLNHTGAHKINNVLGQALLAKKMGKTRLIAETGAGQHGVATATAAALLGMECVVYMGVEDMERQALNVYRMRLLGSEVRGVSSGTGTLKDAVSETFREWTSRIDDTHYCLGSVMGPHPFPTIVRDFQAVISRETRAQILEREGRLPDAVVACVGGGSNAIGSFYHFIPDEGVRLIGCEAAGRGVETFETAATIATGRLGIFHGMKSYFCQDEFGQIAPVYSISAGLDYPGIGPEHAHLHDVGRAEYVPITDEQAVAAFEYLSRIEGIIPAVESAHAVAYAMELAPQMDGDGIIVVTLSGRGDKDVAAIARYRGEDLHE